MLTANARVNDYWHLPAPAAFVDWLITSTGLTPEDQQIARNYRRYYGSTQYFADLMHMPLKRFSARSGEMHRRIIAVLVPLAIEGWRYKHQNPT